MSMTILDAVAEATGADLVDLPPLYEHIDPDALDTIFATQSGRGQVEGSISFEFAGYPITVHSSGEVVVYSD